jgi:predicted Zn-dependent protease
MSFVDTRLKIRQWLKKYRRIIIITLIALAIVYVVNYILKNLPEEEIPKTTYTPNISVMAEDEVPEKWHETIESTIDTFVQRCNNKEYEAAYNMISDDCKEAVYPTLSSFQKFVDAKFKTKRSYSIQNFSNVGKQYIYDVNLMEDLMATGLTGKELYTDEEKFVFTEDDESLKLAISGFVRKNDLNIFAEDENLKVNIDCKYVFYDYELYKVTITNKTEHSIVIADGTTNDEVVLNTGADIRGEKYVKSYGIVLEPGESKNYTFEFTKYCDDGSAPIYIMFNNIRVLQSYSGDSSTRQAELDNAIRIYSLRINFPTAE